MLERLNNILRARKENDKGFSLVELAVVVVILGALVAIAIPIFMNLQTNAEANALKAAAANGASTVAVAIANGNDPTAMLALMDPGEGATLAVAATGNDGLTLSDYCVTATKGTATAKSGPTCA